jgi:hypothetical protein
MSENPEKPQSRVTPKQWLTVGVLATIFVTVLIFQFGTAGASPKPLVSKAGQPDIPRPPTVTRAATGTAAANSGQETPKSGHPKSDHPWPGFPLAKVLEFDPFAQPASLAAVHDGIPTGSNVKDLAVQKSEDAEKKHAQRERAITQLRQEMVRAVVGTNHGFAAIVGKKTIRVGDQFHGFRVKEINADGVILQDDRD